MVTDPVLGDLTEQVGERLLAQAPHAARRQFDAPALLFDQTRVSQRLGQLGQVVEGARRILAHVRPDLVEIDLAERGGRRRRLQDLLHAIELAQPRGQVGGAVDAHRTLAREIVGTLPARLGEGALEVLGEALHLPAEVHVLEHGVGQLPQLRLLLGAQRIPHRLGRGHPLRQLLEQLVEVLGVAREQIAEALHELPEARVQLLAPFALLEHAVEGVVGVPHPRHLLGAHVRQRFGGALEEGLGHLATELVEQGLKALTGFGGDEVVVLEGADTSGGIVGLKVQGHPPLGGHVVGDLPAPLVARRSSLLEQIVDGRPLVTLDLVELAGQVGHASVGIAFGQHLGTALAELLEQIAQARHVLTVGPVEPPAQEPPQCVVEVPSRQEVVGESGQQLISVEVGEFLRAVPRRVVVSDAHPRGTPPERSAMTSVTAVLLPTAVQGARTRGVLVEPLGQVQALEEELQRARHESRGLGLGRLGTGNQAGGGLELGDVGQRGQI